MRITVWVVRTISLKLPENLLVQLDAEAKTRRVTKSWLIREASKRLCSSCPVWRSLVLRPLPRPGRLSELPKDLAENPDYMEGFGK